MVLLPYTKNGDATQGRKFFLLYTKDNNPNNKRHEFQTHEPIVCKAKKTIAACMKESKKGKKGEEK
jgi:hypothetical protein